MAEEYMPPDPPSETPPPVEPPTTDPPVEEPGSEQPTEDEPPMVCGTCGRELKVLERLEDIDGTYQSMGCIGKGCEAAMFEQRKLRL